MNNGCDAIKHRNRESHNKGGWAWEKICQETALWLQGTRAQEFGCNQIKEEWLEMGL